jgi:hypothetical protein
MRAVLWRSLEVAAGHCRSLQAAVATSTRALRTSAGDAVPNGTRAMRQKRKSHLRR